jgi:hypothetical protein
MSKYRKINNNKGIAIQEPNSGSTGAYHSIIYGDFSMLIAGINILLSLLTSFNKTDKVLLEHHQNLPYPVNK